MAAETKKSQKNEGNFLTGIRTYFNEVRTELNKVSWPDRDDVIRLTQVVLIVTIISSLFLGFLSIVLGVLLNNYGPNHPLLLVALFVVIIAVTVYSLRSDSNKGY